MHKNGFPLEIRGKIKRLRKRTLSFFSERSFKLVHFRPRLCLSVPRMHSANHFGRVKIRKIFRKLFSDEITSPRPKQLRTRNAGLSLQSDAQFLLAKTPMHKTENERAVCWYHPGRPENFWARFFILHAKTREGNGKQFGHHQTGKPCVREISDLTLAGMRSYARDTDHGIHPQVGRRR